MSEIHFMTFLAGAALAGMIHVLIGPDHYVPFIVMSKAGRWSKRKTFWITSLSGLAHIFSSVIIGIVAIALGVGMERLMGIESLRGNLAGWALLTFGVVYFVWGLRRALKNKIEAPGDHADIKPWIIFTIFIFGPCEPMIPFLMTPLVKDNLARVLAVSIVFGGMTIVTMLVVVFAASFGLNFLPVKKMARYQHAFAGFLICLCGVAVQFLGI